MLLLSDCEPCPRYKYLLESFFHLISIVLSAETVFLTFYETWQQHHPPISLRISAVGTVEQPSCILTVHHLLDVLFASSLLTLMWVLSTKDLLNWHLISDFLFVSIICRWAMEGCLSQLTFQMEQQPLLVQYPLHPLWVIRFMVL